MIPEPKSPYSITKLDGEYYCDMFTKTGRLQTACLRYFNVFGPRQNPKSAYAAAVPIFITKALADEDITIFGDGEQTRDFVFVKTLPPPTHSWRNMISREFSMSPTAVK